MDSIRRRYSKKMTRLESQGTYLCAHRGVFILDQVPKDSDILVHCRSDDSQIAIMQLFKLDMMVQVVQPLGRNYRLVRADPDGIIG